MAVYLATSAWTNGATVVVDHGYTAGKRGLDDETDFPAKRLKQLLHDGYIVHGQEWANQAFQNVTKGALDSQMVETVSTANHQEFAAQASMDVETQNSAKEGEWWAWWNERIRSCQS
uniref:Uncharacterized protein n=1 Tax=Cryptomonas curvata TaxID=233186 RepID=A0A7S0LXT1_9CRYP|mmetsp:Transcript_15260/g.32617  ORF Transcript_15260/g.32617 Transcript_15260/m.32617 type:complete len:117 (+) Transcript_15260:90-440(+)